LHALRLQPSLYLADQLAAPDFDAGAMENWGLVLYREPYLLWDPAIDTIWNKYSVTSIIGHELAHQVTLKYLTTFYIDLKPCTTVAKSVSETTH